MNTTRHRSFSFLAVMALTLFVSFSLASCGSSGGGGTNPTYTVTYDGNGGDSGTAPADSTKYEAGQLVTVPGNTGSLVKSGYSFVGWNTASNGTGTTYTQTQTFTMGPANVTLYAKWTANPVYTVTYDGNGSDSGTVPVDSTSYEAGQTVTVSGNTGGLVKSGNSFIGWNTAANGSGITYTQEQTFAMGTANVTLYARWTTNPTYTVTYDSDGVLICVVYYGGSIVCDVEPATSGSVPTDSSTYEEGQTVTVRGNTGSLVKTGYTFAGWSADSWGLGTTYTEGQTFPMGPANVTLYVMWNASTFTDNLNGTITDNRSGLMWQKAPPTVAATLTNWSASIADLTILTYTDWRLPTQAELSGLIQGWTGASPAAWLASQGFSNIQANRYWTNTYDPSIDLYYYVDMSNAGSDLDAATSSYCALAVRP